MIDTHCHFDDAVFDADRDDLVLAMERVGVSDIIIPAISAETWPRLKSVTDSSPRFHACYGLHPMFMEQHQAQDLTALKQWLSKEKAVAVGECGLDYFIPELDKNRQLELFVQHLQLAREFDLPLIIHARRALDDVLKQIRRIGSLRGVIHSFSGSQQQADKLIENGFYLGIGGTVSYERAQRLRKVVATVPEGCLLLETDAPYQPDSQWRGKRNDPTRLPVIVAEVAGLRNTTPEHIAGVTTQNAQRLFEIE